MQYKTYRIKKSNFLRILVTETLPTEVPIMFSNDGFYANCHLKSHNATYLPKEIFDCLITPTKINNTPTVSFTIPFLYKVRKNDLEVRNLALIHPRVQLEIVDFYKAYDSLICFYTSKSDASLRAPRKVAGTYYIKNPNSEFNKYKSPGILNTYEDLIYRHSSSYFSYRGFKKIHKFYDSASFNQFESNYSKLWLMDVSKCFDSIYTHSLAWACKDKKHVKKNLGTSSTFADLFDDLMQRTNYKETNGIVIGPEVSRVFAEIIFQEIDSLMFSELKSKSLISGKDYVFKRYVDDCFIFCHDDAVAQKIYNTYSDILNKFKMHVNVNKVEKLKRPFLTKKSKIILETNIALTNFFESFTEHSSWKEKRILKPKKVFREKSLSLHFINSIKNVCSSNDSSYDSISNYVISACVKRIDEIILFEEKITEKEDEFKYRNTFIVILDVMYFFYSVAPSVNSSYKFAKGILLLVAYVEKYLPNFSNTIKNQIFQSSLQILCAENDNSLTTRENFLSLEKINLLLSISDLGSEYLLPPKNIKSLFNLDDSTTSISYYHLISCLYYTKSESSYSEINLLLNNIVMIKLENLDDIKKESEKAHLFLDALACPYISKSNKEKLIEKFYLSHEINLPTITDINKIINYMELNPWFVGWTRINLLNMLERKELMQTYS